MTLVDLDSDGIPEIVLTLADGEDAGRIYAFRRLAGKQAFAPIPCEVGSGIKPRDFMVWDLSGGATAPVTITTQGHFLIRSKYFAVLSVSQGVATYRFRFDGGIIRYVETIPEAVASRRP